MAGRVKARPPGAWEGVVDGEHFWSSSRMPSLGEVSRIQLVKDPIEAGSGRGCSPRGSVGQPIRSGSLGPDPS